jgi:hypothetical protein
VEIQLALMFLRPLYIGKRSHRFLFMLSTSHALQGVASAAGKGVPLTIASLGFPFKATSRSIAVLAGFALLAFTARVTVAQICLEEAPRGEAMLSLPDPPRFSTSATSADDPRSSNELASFSYPLSTNYDISLPTRRDMTILPGETSHPLSAHGKVVLGLRESMSIFSILGWSTSSGYSHLVDGSPNYGTDKAAFGERLGATALRNVSESIFSVSLFAPLLHEDPRYFELGPGHNVAKRVVYAASRSLITRTDSGHSSVNFSLLAGNALGSALTNAYYPERNRGFGQTMQTFGTSVGGSAFGFAVTEFLNQALAVAHLKKPE